MKRSRETQSTEYLMRRLTGAKSVLANPLATDAQRHGARCRLNRAIDTLRGLRPVPLMRRALQERLLGGELRPAAAA